MIKLSTALEIGYKKDNSNILITQNTSTVITPFESYPYALIFASHIFHLTEYPQKLISKLLKENFVIIYFCDALPKNLKLHKNIIYIKSPWRYFDTSTIKNINLFSCVAGVGGNKAKKIAKQYSIKFNKPQIFTTEDVNKIRKIIKEEKQKKTTILFDVTYNCSDRGIGDVLLTTPIIIALKKKFNADITYACREKHLPILQYNPDIRKVITEYTNMDSTTYTYHLPLIRHTEDYKIKRNQQNRIDSMADLFMVELEDRDKRPKVYLTEIELEWSRMQVPKDDRIYRIGMNIEATAHSRRWIYSYLIDLVKDLNNAQKYNFEIYLFGQGQNFKGVEESIPAIVKNYIHKTTLRQMMAMLYRMDLILSVDSLFSHLAGALDIPSVVIYSSIPARWRNSYYRSIGVQSSRKCCPCMDFQFVKKEDYDKCDRFGIPPCIRDITADKVKNSIYQLIKKYKIKPGK